MHLVSLKQLLLRAQQAAGPPDAIPADECPRWEAEVLHGVEANERACAAQAHLAVHGHSTGLAVRDVEELGDDLPQRA